MFLYETVAADSFLEYAFLRWVLHPAVRQEIANVVIPQFEATVDGRAYKIDYVIGGSAYRFAIELDGFEFHGNRHAFSYDRMRQNDLHAAGFIVVRFSYD